MKQYIIDYDEDLINKNKIKENINKNIIPYNLKFFLI